MMAIFRPFCLILRIYCGLGRKAGCAHAMACFLATPGKTTCGKAFRNVSACLKTEAACSLSGTKHKFLSRTSCLLPLRTPPLSLIHAIKHTSLFFLKYTPPNHERKKLLRYSLTAETQEQLCHFCHETACDALQELGLEHTLKLAHAVLFAYFTLGVLASLPGGDLTEQAKHNIKLLQELLNCAEIELESTYHITKSEQ